MSDPLVIDLFTGAGGLSLGLHKAGLAGLFAVEKDAMAFQTLHRNLIADHAPYRAFGKWPDWLPIAPMGVEDLLERDDLRSNLSGLAGQVSVLAGGPPCQGFSVGGARNGKDIRNDLVFRMLEVASLVRPQAILIENVEGITRRFVARPGERSHSSVADQAVEELARLGYDAGFRILDASDFGVPQARRRVVIFGIAIECARPHSDFFDALDLIRDEHLRSNGLPLQRAVTAGEALADLHNPGNRQQSSEWPKFETSPYRKPVSDYAKLMRRGIPADSLPDSHRYSKHTDKIRALFDAAHATQPKGRLSRQFLESNECKSDKKVLIDPDSPVSTLTSHPDEFIHYEESRIITVREMARLQSFPDNFHFCGRYTINGDRRGLDVSRCVQVGNAVPPLFAEALGRALMRLMND